jgi:hypothetical protein
MALQAADVSKTPRYSVDGKCSPEAFLNVSQRLADTKVFLWGCTTIKVRPENRVNR